MGLSLAFWASHPMRVARQSKACRLCLGEWREFLWHNATSEGCSGLRTAVETAGLESCISLATRTKELNAATLQK
jgi:hypothetical protein